MKKRITALLLCCVMLLTLCPGLISTATAYDDTQPDQAEATGETVQPTVNFTNVAPFLPPVSGGVRMLRASSYAALRAAANFAANDAANDTATDNGMKISKTATANADGSYTIMLEAYATGAKVISEITKDVPTDIILVLDQSGSMADDIGQVQYTAYTGNNTQNKRNYEKRHNGGSANLWHKLPNGSFVSVSVTKTTTYKELNTKLPNYSSWNECYWDYANNLYEKVGDEYKKVELSVNESGDWYDPTYTYTYTFADGTTVTSVGNASTPDFGSHAPLYTPVADGNNTVYTYTYTDTNGTTQTIGTSTGANTKFTPAFYQRSTTTSGGGSRLNALKSAATSFANQVATKANGTDGFAGTDDDVKHRIAVVGYAGSSSNLTNGFKQMNNTSQAADVSSAIDNLTANGGTHIDQGLSTANGIFANNPIGDTENRNRVVIVFTDGAPGSYGDWCSESVQTANNAIAYAKTAKKPTSEGGYGATVYTIGIFSGADASNPDSLPAYTSYTTGWLGSEQSPSEADQVKNSNRFMHLVSSNYPDASSIDQPGNINPNLNGKSYYLSAGDEVSLNSIFQQISDQIETGGTSSTLTANAVVKDIISPQFTLPEGATASDITLETYACTGKDGENYTWSKNTDAMGARATITSTDSTHETTTRNQVSVTGFDFAENYVGTVTENGQTTYRGNKLVITFKVEPRPGFLGGNDVITNTNAGVYENSSAENPVMTFDQPQVDVTIKEPDITLPDANVYLGAYFSETVNAEDLKNGTKVKFGDDIELDLTKPNENWGLESWQTEYVTIEVKVTDKDGNEVTNFEKLTEDTEYKVSVSIKPKTPKTGNSGYDESMAGTIHVFKPELTFKDSTAYYGESVPANNDYSSNYVANSEKWKNGGKYSTDDGVQMIGTKPTLDITYTPDGSKLEGGKYTKQDLPVKATVNIGTDDVTSYTTFLHETCTVDGCKWNNEITSGNPAFLLHVNTCTLTITKTGCDTVKDANQSFIFNVTGNQGNNVAIDPITVTVQENGSATIVGLPVGRYTVTEDGHWSWRYEVVEDGNGSATLSAKNPTAEVTITNQRTATKWLSGDNYAVNHVGGIKMPQGTFAGSN